MLDLTPTAATQIANHYGTSPDAPVGFGVRSTGGVVTVAPTEEKARKWAAHDFKRRIGDCGEVLVTGTPGGHWEPLAA